jgi:hypothetical protein
MAHPYDHSRSSVKRWGGKEEDYMPIHNWFDETKAWVGHSIHRMFRHHSEGIFESEKVFGIYIINSDGRKVYTRYIGEQHVKEDCNGKIPSAKEWVDNINTPQPWMIKTEKLKLDETERTINSRLIATGYL